MSVRPYEAADFEDCLRLYQENEPGRFPPDTVALYAAYLRHAGSLTLILEQDGETVGAGSVGLKSDLWAHRYGWLTFGLVAPTHHRRGLGTVLFLARIALLPTEWLPIPVYLSAVEQSRSFYEQFGFQLFCRNVDGTPVAGYFVARVPPGAVAEARGCLEEAGIKLPAEGMSVPVLLSDSAEGPGDLSVERAGERWLNGAERAILTCRFSLPGQTG